MPPPTYIEPSASAKFVASGRFYSYAGLLVLATVGALRTMKRPWWCECAGDELCAWNVWSQHNSQHWLDPYGVSHALHGMIFCGAIWWLASALNPQRRLLLAIAAEGVWELLENSPLVIQRYRANTAALGYTGDSIANSLGDVACCVAGYLLARRLGLWWSIGVMVLAELLLLFWIRDCLTLNMVMLLTPIDRIRQWQLEIAP